MSNSKEPEDRGMSPEQLDALQIAIIQGSITGHGNPELAAAVRLAAATTVLNLWLSCTYNSWSVHMATDPDVAAVYYAVHDGRGKPDWSEGTMLASASTDPLTSISLAAIALAEAMGAPGRCKHCTTLRNGSAHHGIPNAGGPGITGKCPNDH